METTVPQKNDRKTIFGWCMYDWANSAYVTTVAVALLPAYFAGQVVGPDGVLIGGTIYSATSLWGFMVGLAAFVTFLFSPVLGAISDFSASKKRFLVSFAYGGSLFTILLYFCHSGDVIQTMIFFLVAQVGFIGGNVFYDAFLPQIASEDHMDRVSAKGFSYGYLGGGLQFALALGLVAGHRQLGLSQAMAARLGMVMAGFWWAGFTLFTIRGLRETQKKDPLPDRYRKWPALLAYAAVGLSRTVRTTRRVGRFRHLLLFLIAFMLYNDGIQTVINMATIYGKDELNLTTTSLMLTLLAIQAVAIFGALIFSRIADVIGTKRAVMVTLILWSGVVIYAYFIVSAVEFFVLGMTVGLVLGGSQALSRSFYGAMIPEEASAEFYGFYTVFSKFSAIWGPMVFAVIRQVAGSSRLSIVSLIVFFVLGLVLLSFVDVEKAREAKKAGAF
ncbi:MAG: MFS transporter [Deltaproteobacteria bacterium]|nr:MFS transporter [Deltaproteobacteria bacterium]